MSSIPIKSAAIEEAVQTAQAHGNAVAEISEGWSRVLQVVSMAQPLSDDLRRALMGYLALRYWTSDPSPHNRAEEGFTDDAGRVSIAFPRLGCPTGQTNYE